jgi:gas vesicle protein GvpN
MQANIPIQAGKGDQVALEASDRFVTTSPVNDLVDRALTYLAVGYPIHFAGPAGTGKTTMAFHAAAMLGRPVVLIHGDSEFSTSDLVGKDTGYRRSRLVDNYVRSVVKTEEQLNRIWEDQRLTACCRKGYTLIYDEFTRSRPEANNVLLSVLEEGVLNVPKLQSSGEGYIRVHPNFRALFTSNPREYVGTHKSQDALLDRMITIQLGHYDRETEIMITMARSEICREDAEVVVDLVRDLRGVGVENYRPTIRACIAIGRVMTYRGAHANADDPVFRWVCTDILGMETCQITKNGKSLMPKKLGEALERVLSGTREE